MVETRRQQHHNAGRHLTRAVQPHFPRPPDSRMSHGVTPLVDGPAAPPNRYTGGWPCPRGPLPFLPLDFSPQSDTFKVETGARRLVAAWRIGKTVQFRCGPAAVTGDETLTKPLRQTADASSRQRGKARVEDDPEARRPARFSVDVVSLEDKGPLVFRRHRFPPIRPALGGRLAKPLPHSSARPIGIARASSLAMRGLPCLTPGLAGAVSRWLNSWL